MLFWRIGFGVVYAWANETRMSSEDLWPCSSPCYAGQVRGGAKLLMTSVSIIPIIEGATALCRFTPVERREPTGVFTEPHQPDLFRNTYKEIPITRFHQLEYQPPLPHFRSPPPLFTTKTLLQARRRAQLTRLDLTHLERKTAGRM